MMRSIPLVVVCSLLLVPAGAFGQGVITEIKTPPLAESDTYTIPLALHFPDTVVNWAGARVTIHIRDNQEVDITSVTPYDVNVHDPGNTTRRPLFGGQQTAAAGPGPGDVGRNLWGDDPFGPRSDNLQSVPIVFTVWDPNAHFSGNPIVGSQNQPLLTMVVHAKNTDPINNSDVDITVAFSAIYHVPQVGPDHVVRKSELFWQQGQVSEQPWITPDGTWVHAIDTFVLPPSGFYAQFLNVANIGIEHIPEPTAFWFFGIAACIAGTRMGLRRRRP